MVTHHSLTAEEIHGDMLMSLQTLGSLLKRYLTTFTKMAIKKVEMDPMNRMLRAGFGLNQGRWFIRIDLWWFGLRISE